MSEEDDLPGKHPKRLSDGAVGRAKSQAIHGVGYLNPPKHTHYRKGQSGNPAGRPRAPKADGLSLEEQPLLNAVHERAGKSVRMREGNTVSEVGVREALFQSVLATALKGNARSQGLALDLIRAADIQRARDRAERQDLARAYKAIQREKLATAIAAGEDTWLILPHPDDVVIDDDYGFHFAGPFDESELRKVEETVRYRDALIMQEVLDERLADREPNGASAASRETYQSGALLFAIALNNSLPPRFRMDDLEIIWRQSRYECVNLRQLLKDAYRAWRAAGAPARRGARFVDLATARRKLAFLFDLIRAFRDDTIDVDAVARGEFDDATLELMDRHGIGLRPVQGAGA